MPGSAHRPCTARAVAAVAVLAPINFMGVSTGGVLVKNPGLRLEDSGRADAVEALRVVCGFIGELIMPG